MKLDRPSLFRVRPDPEIVPMKWKYSGSMVDLVLMRGGSS